MQHQRLRKREAYERAVDRAGHHDSGADPGPDAAAPRGARHGDHPDHARSGRGRRDGRAGGGEVCRQDRGARRRGHPVPRGPAPLHRRTPGLPAQPCGRARRADRHRGHGAEPARRCAKPTRAAPRRGSHGHRGRGGRHPAGGGVRSLQALPGPQRPAVPAHGRRACGGRRASPCGAGSAWGWSERAAPGRRPSGGCCCVSWSRPGGRSCSRAGRVPRRCRGAAGAAPGDADDLPGPVFLAQPAHDGGADDSRTARHSPPGPGQRAGATRRPVARRGRAPSGARAALSARVLRRPAAAHRHSPRPGGQPQARGVRRTGVGARRVDSCPGDQPATQRCSGSSASPTCS